ncbi:MAG: GGDEF domain-containing protein, partial [Pseudomonadota bacterium]
FGTLRASDVFARWGGEEFLALFPDTPVEEARQAMERLRVWLAQQDLTRTRLGLKTTFSAGLAEWDPAQTVERNLAQVDEALYRAKHEGRDRCVVSAPPGASGKTPSDG